MALLKKYKLCFIVNMNIKKKLCYLQQLVIQKIMKYFIFYKYNHVN